MKKDLDTLMEQRGMDAIVAAGQVHGNPTLYYLTNGAGLTRAIVVKRKGHEAVLIVSPMEREEASAAGLSVVLSTQYNYIDLLNEHDGDLLATDLAYYRRILEDQGATGRVGFYGLQDWGRAYTFLNALDATPGIEVVGEYGPDLFTEARATKAEEEVERVRDVGRRTMEVVRETVAFLQGHAVGDDEVLVTDAGLPLTVGEVHAHIRHVLAIQGLEDPEGFIFATGRDAGIPHSKGSPEKPLRLGESIVFDIFPREAGGGYFYDMTRTFCLGYAPEEVRRIYEDTFACLQAMTERVEAGMRARRLQQMTCEFYSERGHPTVGEDVRTLEGYVHSLGHGLGLNLHEEPFFRDVKGNDVELEPGHVFTLEPGLYYPDDGMGCRLENVVWLDEEGALQNLTPFPYDLVVSMD
jgi:Xaa-Pro aminopeptidase